MPLDTPNRCQDIYLQQATTFSSHVNSKSLQVIIISHHMILHHVIINPENVIRLSLFSIAYKIWIESNINGNNEIIYRQ